MIPVVCVKVSVWLRSIVQRVSVKCEPDEFGWRMGNNKMGTEKCGWKKLAKKFKRKIKGVGNVVTGEGVE